MAQQRGPKEGGAQPTTKEWKEAVKLRLDALRWNQSDLAREVTKIGEPDGVEATPSAISHVLTKAKQSTLVPYIEEAIGWHKNFSKERANRAEWERNEVALSPAELRAQIKQLIGDTQQWAGSPERQALDDVFDQLTDVYKGRLLERAFTLLELQRAEQRISVETNEAETEVVALRDRMATHSRAAMISVQEVHSALHQIRVLNAQESQVRKTMERVTDSMLEDQDRVASALETAEADLLLTTEEQRKMREIVRTAKKEARKDSIERGRAELEAIEERRIDQERRVATLHAQASEIQKGLIEQQKALHAAQTRASERRSLLERVREQARKLGIDPAGYLRSDPGEDE